MTAPHLPIGCFLRLDKPDLQAVLDSLKQKGYRVLGPRVSSDAVVLDDLDRVEQIPVGCQDQQEPGSYRLKKTAAGRWFDYVVGPNSLKSFLFPARATLMESIRVNGTWKMRVPPPPAQPLAIVGLRACDLAALRLLDRTFLGGDYVDPDYQARRQGLFILAVNCARAAPTCFCTSMGTGPAVKGGADLSLYELDDHFVIEVGSDRGGEIIAPAPWQPCSAADITAAAQVPAAAEKMIRRRLDTLGLHDLLLGNLEHARWDETANRCLSCGSCTLACPTCFCSTVEEQADLTGTSARRVRMWDTCFNDEHSYMNSGTVRKFTRARYRQWLTHKLASWTDQFGSPGCTGCGRCITWCPVGIDLTEEVAAIRGGTA